MGASVISSYDATPTDDDGLALGKMLARAGLRLALAYVRHSGEFDPRRKRWPSMTPDQRLGRVPATLGDAEITRHVVIGDVRNELNSARRSVLVLAPSVPPVPLALRLPEGLGRGVGKALAVGVPSTDARWRCLHNPAKPNVDSPGRRALQKRTLSAARWQCDSRRAPGSARLRPLQWTTFSSDPGS